MLYVLAMEDPPGPVRYEVHVHVNISFHRLGRQHKSLAAASTLLCLVAVVCWLQPVIRNFKISPMFFKDVSWFPHVYIYVIIVQMCIMEVETRTPSLTYGSRPLKLTWRDGHF